MEACLTWSTAGYSMWLVALGGVVALGSDNGSEVFQHVQGA
jgi:hypothetical protein